MLINGGLAEIVIGLITLTLGLYQMDHRPIGL